MELRIISKKTQLQALHIRNISLRRRKSPQCGKVGKLSKIDQTLPQQHNHGQVDCDLLCKDQLQGKPSKLLLESVQVFVRRKAVGTRVLAKDCQNNRSLRGQFLRATTNLPLRRVMDSHLLPRDRETSEYPHSKMTSLRTPT